MQITRNVHEKRRRRRCCIRTAPTLLPLLIALLVARHRQQLVSAYITSTFALPAARQVEWLKELTVDFCEKTATGSLSADELEQASELIRAWSHQQQPPSSPIDQRLRSKKRQVPNSSDKDMTAALAVESILKRVIDERMAGNTAAILSVRDYNCLLQAWAHSGLGVEAAERCEQILFQMVQQQDDDEAAQRPNLESWKAVLLAWRRLVDEGTGADKGKVAERAQRVLELMVSQAQNKDEIVGVLPDADCFEMVLQTWSKSQSQEAPRKAEQLLCAMERIYRMTGQSEIEPRTSSFNLVLTAWARQQYQAGHDSVAPAMRAADILAFMEHLSMQQGDGSAVAPDLISYTSVISALAHVAPTLRPKAAAMGGSLLRRSLQVCDPDTILFNTVMGCWAKSNVPRAYRQARSVLDQQFALYAKTGKTDCMPDVYGYTSVIASCCAAARGRNTKQAHQAAFRVASQTYQELQTDASVDATHVSYATMLRACTELLPTNSAIQVKWVRRVFQDACHAGCVSGLVMKRLEEAASLELYMELLGGHSRHMLPRSWSRNVDDKNNKKTSRKRANRSVARKR